MRKIIGRKKIAVVIVEILVAFVIVVLLTKYEIPRAPYYGNRRCIAADQTKELEHALEIYRFHNGFFPTTEQGLEALVIKPTTNPLPEKYPEGGYMKRLPLDPWRNPFIYRCHGIEGPIDIISCGPDEIEGTDDDVTNHNRDTISGPYH